MLHFLDDLSASTNDLCNQSWPLLIVALIFICLAALTVMNILIGVLCEVFSAVATTEKEEILARTVLEKMLKIADALDTNFNQQNLVSGVLKDH